MSSENQRFYPAIRIHVSHTNRGLIVYREARIRAKIIQVIFFLVYLYAVLHIAFVFWGADGDVVIRIIGALGVPAVVTCFCIFIAWYLFNTDRLVIDAIELKYNHNVIIPCTQINKPLSLLCGDILLQPRFYGAWLKIDTDDMPIAMFYIPFSGRNGGHYDTIVWRDDYRTELLELEQVAQQINNYLCQIKKTTKNSTASYDSIDGPISKKVKTKTTPWWRWLFWVIICILIGSGILGFGMIILKLVFEWS